MLWRICFPIKAQLPARTTSNSPMAASVEALPSAGSFLPLSILIITAHLDVPTLQPIQDKILPTRAFWGNWRAPSGDQTGARLQPLGGSSPAFICNLDLSILISRAKGTYAEIRSLLIFQQLDGRQSPRRFQFCAPRISRASIIYWLGEYRYRRTIISSPQMSKEHRSPPWPLKLQ